MIEPWFNENLFGALYGAIGGGLGGTLIGCWGAAVGICSPRGIGKKWIVAIGWAFLALGILSLGFGLAALLMGQPFGIWYAPTLAGGLAVAILSALMPMVYRRYSEADARKLQAEQFRVQ